LERQPSLVGERTLACTGVREDLLKASRPLSGERAPLFGPILVAQAEELVHKVGEAAADANS
jgi:hypothetical protein